MTPAATSSQPPAVDDTRSTILSWYVFDMGHSTSEAAPPATRGRRSLSGAGDSPQIRVRVPAELRTKADELAQHENKSISELAREALETRVDMAWPAATALVETTPSRSPIRFARVPGRRRTIEVPTSLPRLPLERAFASVTLPLTLNWSEPGRVFRLADRHDRARVYEIVLREGTSADILSYIDGALLVDLWPDLVLPRDLRSAWQPLIEPFAAV